MPDSTRRNETEDDVTRAIRDAVIEGYERTKATFMKETRILLFGPGNNQPEWPLRKALKRHLERYGCRVGFPEDVLKSVGIEPYAAEQLLATQYNLIFVLLAGVGPVAEFSGYIRIANLAPKFRILQESRYKGKASFVNSVIRPFCNLNPGYCGVFSNETELRDVSSRMIETYFAYFLAYGHRAS